MKYYNTADWTTAGTITLGQAAVGIAVKDGKYLYTAPFTGKMLSQYDLIAGSEYKITKTYGTVGLAVDQDTGRVYATTGYSGDRVEVYDSNLAWIANTGDIGDPTGLCIPRTGVSYNPLNLAKTDGVATVNPGGTLTYTISYTNTNPDPVTNVVITDTLPVGGHYSII